MQKRFGRRQAKEKWAQLETACFIASLGEVDLTLEEVSAVNAVKTWLAWMLPRDFSKSNKMLSLSFLMARCSNILLTQNDSFTFQQLVQPQSWGKEQKEKSAGDRQMVFSGLPPSLSSPIWPKSFHRPFKGHTVTNPSPTPSLKSSSLPLEGL